MTSDKVDFYRKIYTENKVIELISPIDDLYSPKPTGAKLKIKFVDDALQIHGTWLPPESGSLAVNIDIDNFKIIDDEEVR